MLFAIAFRWTAVTGGESGLGGVVRPSVLGVDLGSPTGPTTAAVAVHRLARRAICCGASIARRSASVLVAIRENEQRARFIGYPTDRYKLFAFTASAADHRRSPARSRCSTIASRRPSRSRWRSPASLLAMVVIGGMRSFLGPALGALFFILFREFLSIWTPNWLLYFGLLFVGFIVFSPTGLVGVAERAARAVPQARRSRRPRWPAATCRRMRLLPAALAVAPAATGRC